MQITVFVYIWSVIDADMYVQIQTAYNIEHVCFVLLLLFVLFFLFFVGTKWGMNIAEVITNTTI